MPKKNAFYFKPHAFKTAIIKFKYYEFYLIEVNKIGAVVVDDFSLTPVVYIGVLEMKAVAE